MTTSSLRIRRVSVELLRPGPSHNQLLSPYTQYLAVCNEAGAAVVTVPYEHRVFERRLKELRYETGDQTDRLDMLHEIGRDMGQVLEAVPGFTGALMHDPARGATLVHLRVVLSAAELALLPFELAEVPVGSAASAVSIQTRPPVSITRHIRTVSAEGLEWPDKPRVLFVSGDPENVPFAEHRQVLMEAIQRFRYPKTDVDVKSRDGRREQVGDLLTILIDPTLIELQRECESTSYTHIHVLTHGDVDVMSKESYGLVLRDENGSSDVVSGKRFVSAITRVGHRPAVVTIASCDSGNVGSVVIPGASFVHAVHQAGIPFVVGAQFPLSKDGSVPLTERLYGGLLWGEHPLHVLQQARAELHARYTNWHDWASVVVYEALPPGLDDQLDRLRYTQAKRAMNAALEAIDLAVADQSVSTDEALVRLNEAVSYAIDRMPLDGGYAIECIGLRATSRKRLAYAAFTLAGARNGERGPFEDLYDLLDRARLDYHLAAKGLLVNDARALQRNATLHWVLVQAVALTAVLEHPWDQGEWDAALLSAKHYREHEVSEQRAWAHGSLAELWLLGLTKRGIDEEQRARCVKNACDEAEQLDRCYPGVDEFPVKSTRRQFERYIEWWGTDRFERDLGHRGRSRAAAWASPGSVAETAKKLVDILRRGAPAGSGKGSPGTPPPSTPTAAPSAGAPPAAAGSGPAVASKGGNGNRGKALSRRSKPEAPAAGARRRDGAFFNVEALPAGHGDCLWIEYGDRGTTHRVLIDCGTQGTAKALLARVDAVPANERFLELFVLSHIDSDHIGGALPFFKAVKRGLQFGDVWFNGWRHVSGKLGARQGEMFSTAIQDFELPWNVWREGKTILVDADDPPQHVLPGGMTLTLLSPRRAELDRLAPIWTRELKRYALEPGGRVDYSRFLKGKPSTKADAAALKDVEGLADAKFGGDNGAPNGTSIALLAQFGGASALLAADAHAPVLVESINKLLKKRGEKRLKVDLYKVSHHGSQNNVSSELVQLLDCPHYLISTNGDHFFHPDRQAIARILKYGGDKKTIIFNYNTRLNDVWGDAALDEVRKKYNCSVSYPPPDRPGTVVKLL
jgi:beta-lactamase superfamily II metal-dependent hydrolase